MAKAKIKILALHLAAGLAAASGISTSVFAAGEVTNFFSLEGMLYDAPVGTTPLLDASATIRVQILNPAKDCILYDENQIVDTTLTDGTFHISIGSNTGAGKRTGGFDPGNTMVNGYRNTAAMPGGRARPGG